MHQKFCCNRYVYHTGPEGVDRKGRSADFRHCFMTRVIQPRLIHARLPRQLLMKSFLIASLYHIPPPHTGCLICEPLAGFCSDFYDFIHTLSYPFYFTCWGNKSCLSWCGQSLVTPTRVYWVNKYNWPRSFPYFTCITFCKLFPYLMFYSSVVMSDVWIKMRTRLLRLIETTRPFSL